MNTRCTLHTRCTLNTGATLVTGDLSLNIIPIPHKHCVALEQIVAIVDFVTVRLLIEKNSSLFIFQPFPKIEGDASN